MPGNRPSTFTPGVAVPRGQRDSQSVSPIPPRHQSTPTQVNRPDKATLGRNALRGFGAWQWDLAVHRDFPISESSEIAIPS